MAKENCLLKAVMGGSVLLKAVLVLFLAAFGIWIWRLRHVVAGKTDDLRAELIERRRAERELRQHRTLLEHEIRTATGDLRAANARLEESEERLQLAFLAANDGLWDWDMRTDVVYFSPRYFTMLGYEPEGWPSSFETWISLLHPDDREEAVAFARHFSETGERYAQEFRMTAADGSLRWILARGKVVEEDDAGHPLRMVGTHVDITDRKRWEEDMKESRHRLSHSEALLQSVFDAIPDGLMVIDRDRNVVMRNGGLPVQDMAFTGQCHQCLRDTETSCDECHAETVFASGQPMHLEECALKDGKRYEIRLYPIGGAESEVERVIVHFRDVTAQREIIEKLRRSEERYDLAVRGSNDGLWDWDMEGDEVFYSDRFQVLLGYDPGELKVTYEFWRAALHPEDEAKATGVLESHLKTGKPYDVEYRLRCKGGEYKWFRSRGEALRDKQGRPRRMAGSVTDISGRKRDESERERLIKELERRNAEMERFTYTVSHDLKSPLVTIQGFAGRLEKDLAAERWERAARRVGPIVESAEKMKELLNDVLELSRIGRVVNPPSAHPLGEIAREAADLLDVVLKRQRMRLEIDPDLPVVHVDRVRMREVFQNFYENALKYMGDQRTPRIQVGMRRDGEETVFFVADNGMGIDPRYREKIFGIFEQIDPAVEGSGVGLALVKRIVELHGGRVWAESEGVGRGARLCFTLAGAPDEVAKEEALAMAGKGGRS